MQNAHVWNKLNLHWPKVILFLCCVLCMVVETHAQKKRFDKRNNPNYDQRKLSYGFLIGLHSSAYQIKYSDAFVSQQFDSAYSVEPEWSPGFALGFLVNYRITEFLDLRLTPTVAFYEHKLRYTYIEKAETKTDEQLVESTMVEFPLLLKYKSQRRENLRMFMSGGIKPAIEASGKKDIKNVTTVLEVKGGNISLDVGLGLDIYYPLFKFSPEIRFSKGLIDLLDNRTNKYGVSLDRVNANTITVILLFQ
jgi:hypothetical protein